MQRGWQCAATAQEERAAQPGRLGSSPSQQGSLNTAQRRIYGRVDAKAVSVVHDQGGAASEEQGWPRQCLLGCAWMPGSRPPHHDDLPAQQVDADGHAPAPRLLGLCHLPLPLPQHGALLLCSGAAESTGQRFGARGRQRDRSARKGGKRCKHASASTAGRTDCRHAGLNSARRHSYRITRLPPLPRYWQGRDAARHALPPVSHALASISKKSA